MTNGGPVPNEVHRGEPTEVLRAKYHDYCSARVAEVLLELSPDEMYVLAQEASSGSSPSPARSYEEIVQLCTERVSVELDLPPFEAWVEEYLADPSRFDADLLGLWESEPDPER